MVGVEHSDESKQVLVSVNQEILVPTTIFLDRNISILEALCEYLKEEHKFSFAQIGRLTNRDERNIWTSYHRAKEKRRYRTPTTTTDIFFPLSVVCNRSLSIFESIVIYLRNKGINNNKLAEAFNRSAKTISTVYVRAKKK